MNKNNFTLCYGPPKWYKMCWANPSESFKVSMEAGGVTEDLVVAVVCDNGLEFISMDRYDKHTRSWEKHNDENGQHVIAWCKLEIPWQ